MKVGSIVYRISPVDSDEVKPLRLDIPYTIRGFRRRVSDGKPQCFLEEVINEPCDDGTGCISEPAYGVSEFREATLPPSLSVAIEELLEEPVTI